jgi:hypothetical protein
VDTAISSIEPSPGGGSGEGGVSEKDVLNILEKNNYITSSALSSYYTKAESDNRYLASSLLGSNTIIHSGNIGSQSVASAKSLVASNGTTYVSYNSTYGQVNVNGINIGYGGNTIERASSGKLYIQKNVTQDTILNQYGGYVGIGTDSPSYKLDVNGDISAMSALRIGGCGTSFCGLYPNSQITSGGNASRLWLYNEGGLAFYGTSLEILASTSITGNLVVSGDFSFGSDMRFKDKIEDMGISIADIAKAPLFTYKWNDRDDDTIYLGSSAQYWEKIAPWLVSGDDFKSLNYATLGVAMGISLAKKTINHEKRIKILEAEIKRNNKK